MPTILIADDQLELLSMIAMTLEAAGHEVLAARDGVEALELLETHHVDLILADIAMPRMNGYQLYQRVQEHAAWVPIPFLYLTARALDSDIRFGKELGVDDYLTKPIQPEDLLAAVNGRLRRAQQLARAAQSAAAAPGGDGLAIGRLRIAPGQHRAWMDGQPVELSAREFLLLEHLARRAGEVAPPHELIRITHGLSTDDVEAGGLLRPLVRSLRRKLGYDVGEEGCIENVRGVGYRLTPP
jgi:DNA-binding response OmpR family regulator